MNTGGAPPGTISDAYLHQAEGRRMRSAFAAMISYNHAHRVIGAHLCRVVSCELAATRVQVHATAQYTMRKYINWGVVSARPICGCILQ